jgi:hypothetical protein
MKSKYRIDQINDNEMKHAAGMSGEKLKRRDGTKDFNVE